MLSKKFELAGGAATGVLGVVLTLVVPFVRYGSHTLELYTFWPGLLLGDIIAFASDAWPRQQAISNSIRLHE